LVSVADRSKNSNVEYEVDYSIVPAGEYRRTEVAFLAETDRYASALVRGTDGATTGKITHAAEGAQGDTFRIHVRVIDQDGIVVDERVVTDVANGDDLGGGGAADSATLRGKGTAETGTGAKVSFDMENTGETPVDVTGIGIINTTTDAESVGDGDVFAADGESKLSVSVPIDDESPSDTRRDLESPVTVGKGKTITFTFDKFKSYDGGSGPPVDMSGSTIHVRLYFGDGSSRVFRLDVEGSSGGGPGPPWGPR
jgi:hypothetical protein